MERIDASSPCLSISQTCEEPQRKSTAYRPAIRESEVTLGHSLKLREAAAGKRSFFLGSSVPDYCGVEAYRILLGSGEQS